MKRIKNKRHEHGNTPPEREDRIMELATSEEPRLQAMRFLKDLKKSHSREKKINLLMTALHQGGTLAAEILMEDIERNQDLSFNDRVTLQKFKERLQEHKASTIQQEIKE